MIWRSGYSVRRGEPSPLSRRCCFSLAGVGMAVPRRNSWNIVSIWNSAGWLESWRTTLIALGIRTNNESIIEFASSQLTPKSLNFAEVIKILENDLALNEDVIVQMMPDYLRTQFISTDKVPLNSMSEMALLAFSAMGGIIDSEVSEVYIFIPHKQGGLPFEQETILLTSEADIYEISGFDYQTAAAVLSRIGIRPSVVSLSEVKTESGGHCKMDMAGKWMQVVEGKKLRMCPFPELVRQMLKDKTFYEIVDYRFPYLWLQVM